MTERDPGSETKPNPFPPAGVPAPTPEELADLLYAKGWTLLDVEFALICALEGDE